MTYQFSYTFLRKKMTFSFYKKILDELDKKSDFIFLANSDNFEDLDLLIHFDSEKIDKFPEKLFKSIENEKMIVDTNTFIQYLSFQNKSNYIYDILEKFEIPFVEHIDIKKINLKDKKYPYVLKEKFSSKGKGIFFIENDEQLEKLKLYYGNDFKDKFGYSDFIETKSDYYNHYRIFTIGSGEILGSILNYSKNNKKSQNNLEDKIINLNEDLDDPNSEFFLNRKNIASNVSLGGNSIALNPNKKSKKLKNLDLKILNDLNIKNQKLPNFLEEYSKYTAQVFASYGLYILGQDWIEDKFGNFKCLEVNYMPQTSVFNTVYNEGKNNLKKGQEIGAKLIVSGIKKHLDKLNKL